jgi:hypothetical protein
MRLLFYHIMLILTLLSCSERSTIPAVNISDTIRRAEVVRSLDGDTLIEYQTITFTPTDPTVPMSNFYYKARSRDSEKGENYRIYFDKQKVIIYCDSVLKVLGPETEDNFNGVLLYSSILDNAQKGFGETIFVGEAHFLLNRFRPLIVNARTGHKPAYFFTTNRKSLEREDIEREFVSEKGDTLSLSWVNVWIGNMKIDIER